MNILDHISESLETIFWVKKFFDEDPDPRVILTLDPGFGMEKFESGIWDKHPRSATRVLQKKTVYCKLTLYK
jgi:hypothetical protein